MRVLYSRLFPTLLTVSLGLTTSCSSPQNSPTERAVEDLFSPEPRFPTALAEEIVDLLREIFYVGEDDRFEELGTLFETAREEYEDQLELETDPSPEDFKKYLLANASKYREALDTLGQLEVLFDKLELLGLSSLELHKAERNVIRNIASPLLQEDAFVSLIKARFDTEIEH